MTFQRILAAALFMGAAFQSAEPAQTDFSQYVWDLSPLYATDGAWENDLATVRSKIEKIGQFKGTLGISAASLANGMDEIWDLRSRAAKLSVYGFLQSDTDTSSEPAQRQYDVGTSLESRVESAVSFAAAEIRKIGKERIDLWLKEEPRLHRHRARIHRIFAEASYSATPEAQAVLEDAARWPRLPADLFDSLHESDLGWPAFVDSSGQQTRMDRAAYLRIRRSAASADRSRSMKLFLDSLERLQEPFGLLYTRRMEADWILARHRNFQDGIDALWYLREGLPPGSHRVMVDVTRKNLASLHRYAKLRSKAIGSGAADYAGLFEPPRGEMPRFDVQQAMDIAIESSKPIGAEYVSLLRERMKKPWMHLAPAPNKRTTYAVWPPVGGIPPYIIMTYDGNYDYARRLAGAMTLMMSYASWGEANAPDTRDDPAIYSNGMIYVGDILFDDYLKRQASTTDRKINQLVLMLDFLRYHYFQWVLSTEFDVIVQERIRKGDPPGGLELTEIYLRLLRDYNGASVNQEFGREWMIQSVPFLSYEHQFWPGAVAAACKIVEGLQAGDPAARKAVHQVLGFGDSDRSNGLLQQAGIDLSGPEPYLAVIQRMNQLLDVLDTILKEW